MAKRRPADPATPATPDQLDAVRSLVRRAIAVTLVCRGPSTVKDIAAAIGRTPQALYRHIRILEEAGVVARDGERGEGRDREAVYRVLAPALSAPDRPLTDRERAALVDIASTDLRSAERAYRRLAADPNARLGGEDRRAGRISQVMWLTPAERRRLNARLLEVFEEFQPGEDRFSMGRPGAEGYALVAAFFPWDLRDEDSPPAAPDR